MSKIRTEEIRIEKLTKDHIINDFQCYEEELVKCLQEDALDHQNKKISITYLWFLKEKNELIGYFTLLTDKINLEGDLKRYFSDKGVFYHSLPAIKIGRLAVDNRFLRRGIGSLMIEYIVRRAKLISTRIHGCRFITVDAKSTSIPFYGKNRFKVFREGKEGIFLCS